MYDLTGKTALVTGGGRGIGRAIALELGRSGARVAVHYASGLDAAKRTAEDITAAGGQAFTVGADLADPDGPELLIEALRAEPAANGGLDILVNNAGVSAYGTITQVAEEDYDRAFAVNTRSLFFLTRRALELMPDGGRIVNVTSGVTRIAFPEAIAYAMTKGAVDAFTLALAKELGPRSITVNNVAPGITRTDMSASWLHGEAEEAAAARAVLGRVGSPEDVAGPVAFLASDAGRWVTGTTVDATGGSDL